MDWRQFFDDNSLEYVTRGPNTRRGNLSIKCPWCGDDDPSQHLSISPKGVYGCWRNPRHKGADPVYLIQAITGCSKHQAKLIVSQYGQSDPDELAALINVDFDAPPSPPQALTRPLHLPAECRPIKAQGLTGRFYRYLSRRGFDDVDRLAAKYKLTCACSGPYKDRIILPFYSNGRLLGWTGRAISNPQGAPRYLSSGADIKKTIFNEDIILAGGNVLFITEGPFDALKVDYYGAEVGARATCVFGVNMTLDQIAILREATRYYASVRILFDTEASDAAFQAYDLLERSNVQIVQLPPDVKDPGDLDKHEVIKLVTNRVDT